MRTRYKALLILGLLFLVIAIFSAGYIIYLSGHLPEKIYRLSFAFVFIVSIIVAFFIQNPVIIFGENFIKQKLIFKTIIYDWDEVTEVVLNAKVMHPVLLIPRQQTAIVLKFKNRREIILGEEVYQGLSEIRKVIAGKAENKIRN